MANPTSNFGWQMPTTTDLVTDLPADFEVFGQAVDTSLADLKGGTTGQVLSKNSNTDMDFVWVTDAAGDITGVTAGTGISGGGTSGTVTVTNSMATAITTNGDLIYGTGSGTFTRRGIGSTNQVLTVSGGVPAWANPATTATNWTLLNSGGTALTGATTVTVSGISGQNELMVLITNASSVNASARIDLRFNADSGANYYPFGAHITAAATYAAGNFGSNNGAAQNQLPLGLMGNIAGSGVGVYLLVSGCNAAGNKIFHSAAGVNSGSGGQSFYQGGRYDSTSTISSVSIISNSGNLDAGTVFIYGSA
jgi:hypothetical protein